MQRPKFGIDQGSHPLRAALIFPVLIALTACASGVSISRNYIPQRGVPGHADYAATQGMTPVVMLNSPYPAPAVLAALQKNNSRPLVLTSDPPANLKGGYRVLLAFGQIPTGGLYVCREPFGAGASAPAPATAATTSVYGAFCLGPALLSEAVATTSRIDSATDPRLSRLMGDLLTALMPYRDPYDNSRGWCVQPC